MSEPRLEHQNVKVKQLIDDYRSGRMVIPEFQREYVWKKSKAPLLIDSLYRGFPISSLLLWQSDEETRARRRDPRPARAALMSWLIDGQQRVITLARTMSGDEDIEVVFHPEMTAGRDQAKGLVDLVVLLRAFLHHNHHHFDAYTCTLPVHFPLRFLPPRFFDLCTGVRFGGVSGSAGK